jgi:outer membrane phospholipase A
MPPKKKFRLSQKRKEKTAKRETERKNTTILEKAQNDNSSSSNSPKESQPTNFTIGNREKEKSNTTNPVKKFAVQVFKKFRFYSKSQ